MLLPGVYSDSHAVPFFYKRYTKTNKIYPAGFVIIWMTHELVPTDWVAMLLRNEIPFNAYYRPASTLNLHDDFAS